MVSLTKKKSASAASINDLTLVSKKVEKVLLSGVVKKKMFFGNFNERMLILYSTPKLVYYETESGEKKG